MNFKALFEVWDEFFGRVWDERGKPEKLKVANYSGFLFWKFWRTDNEFGFDGNISFKVKATDALKADVVKTLGAFNFATNFNSNSIIIQEKKIPSKKCHRFFKHIIIFNQNTSEQSWSFKSRKLNCSSTSKWRNSPTLPNSLSISPSQHCFCSTNSLQAFFHHSPNPHNVSSTKPSKLSHSMSPNALRVWMNFLNLPQKEPLPIAFTFS
jgi:hypothetical protein